MPDEKRIRLHPEERRLIIRALLQVAKGDPQSTWECWLISRSLAEEVRGKRPRWQGKKRENDRMIRDMEAWSEGRVPEAASPPQPYPVVSVAGEV